MSCQRHLFVLYDIWDKEMQTVREVKEQHRGLGLLAPAVGLFNYTSRLFHNSREKRENPHMIPWMYVYTAVSWEMGVLESMNMASLREL